MDYLDYKRKKNIGINIINKLKNYDTFKNLDSVDKLQQLIKFIQPLLSDSKNKNEQTEDEVIEKEQNIVCKILFIVNSSDPEIMYEIFSQFKNIFSYGGPRRRKYTLPTLVNTIISFCHKMTICYANQKNKLPDFLKVNEKKLNNLVNFMDLGKISNDEAFSKLMLNVYKLLNETITLVAQEIPELALKLYSSAATQVNEILVEPEKFSDICLNYLNCALALLEEGKYSQNIKVELIEDICSNLMKCTILSNELKEEIIQKLINSSENIPKREDQFKIMLIISQLYYTIFKDGQKVLDSMNKARRYADFAMTNSRNLSLFVELINKYLYFVDKADDVVDIKKEKIEDIIELIKGHIRTIKNVPGEDDISYLDDIEKYFNNTIKLIEKRKNDDSNEKLKEFYQSINL
jgi:vacuolar protein sorting-associated protein 35